MSNELKTQIIMWVAFFFYMAQPLLTLFVCGISEKYEMTNKRRISLVMYAGWMALIGLYLFVFEQSGSWQYSYNTVDILYQLAPFLIFVWGLVFATEGVHNWVKYLMTVPMLVTVVACLALLPFSIFTKVFMSFR